MIVWGALILAKGEAEFEVRRLAFRAIFLGEISSVSKDYSTWGDNTFSSNDTFNARTTRPLINVGYPDCWIMDFSNIHRWPSCLFLALDLCLL